MKKSSFASKVIIALSLIFFYLPIIYVIIFSFNSSRSLTNFTGFSFHWYDKMLKTRTMMEAVYYSIIIACLATFLSTVIGTLAAIGLSKSKKVVRESILQINNLSMSNPDIVTAIGFMLFFSSLRLPAGFFTVLLAHVIFCIPYVMLSIFPKLRQLDDDVVEAALDLGCTPLLALVKVLLPQIMPGIISGALTAFTISFDDFVISYFVTGPGVNNISTYVYSSVKRINPSINALSSLIILFLTIILIAINVIPLFFKKRKHKGILGAIALVFCLGGCANNTSSGIGGCNILNVYSWGEYIDNDVLNRFEREKGVRVNYSLFASNEEMYTKLLGGTTYDVIVPSDYMIERMISEKMLAPLQKDLIPNIKNIYAGTLNKDYDLQNTYSLPYFWGNVGLVYDKTIVAKEDIEKEGWNILLNPKYAGKIYMYDSERDAFMVALKALGYSMNTSDINQLHEAYEWLSKLHKTMSPSYVTDEAIDGLTYGEKAMGVMYSGDAAYILSQNSNMAYAVPESGTNIWSDALVIPKNAKCKELAHHYIDYMLAYQQALDNSLAVGYASPNKVVLEELTAEDGEFAGNEAYLPRTDNKKDEVFKHSEESRKLISELWVKVKNQ